MKRYRFEVDLRTSAEPPKDGFQPSGATSAAKAAPVLREVEATPQLEAVYQRLRAQVQAAIAGKRKEEHVFTERGYKHLLFRTGDESVGEIRLAPDGGVVRRVYERMGGELQSLDDLFEVGLSGLEEDEARFARHPGYELRFTRYTAREGKLRKVRMGQASFHLQQGCIAISAF